MSKLKEGLIEKYLVEKVKGKGGRAEKLIRVKGGFFPDRTILINGKIYFVECKTEKGVISEGQKQYSKELEKVGFSIIYINSIEAVDSFVEHNYLTT